YGTVYSQEEIHALSNLAKKNNLFLHMDGARIANAAVSLGISLRELTAGVDVLSFGGTKNGLMFGEAIVFFNKELARNFLFYRKQHMQLASKMRFIAAQFEALLSHDLWKQNAAHSNRLARDLAERLAGLGIEITQKVDANAIFALLPKEV